MKVLRKIFQKLCLLVAIILIILFLVPNIFGIKPYIVLSGSMEPALKTGSIAYINTNTDVEEIKENDIIAFTLNNMEVTHRVVKINDDNTFTTKGDANNEEDIKHTSFNNYIGKTIFTIPYLGYILSFIKSKIGMLIVIGIVTLNIILIILDDDKKDKMKGVNYYE